VPLLVLRAVSAPQLLEAVGPLLGLQPVPRQQQPQQQALVSRARGATPREAAGQQDRFTEGPRMLRWDEVEDDGSEQLLRLLWGGHDGAAGTQQQATGEGGVAPACTRTPRWRAWCVAHAASPSSVDALVAELADADIEDTRDALVPANPTARAGERYELSKPLRPFSRVRRRRLARKLAQIDQM
jgi:hypothetical protein